MQIIGFVVVLMNQITMSFDTLHQSSRLSSGPPSLLKVIWLTHLSNRKLASTTRRNITIFIQWGKYKFQSFTGMDQSGICLTAGQPQTTQMRTCSLDLRCRLLLTKILTCPWMINEFQSDRWLLVSQSQMLLVKPLTDEWLFCKLSVV